MVARPAPFGGVIARNAADAEEAVKAGVIARDAARRFLALDPPPFLIGPGDGAAAQGKCVFLFVWHFPRPGSAAPRLPSHVLPHEIGHELFIRFLAPESGSDEYGGGAPDWLDEMAAVAFEDEVGVAMRRSEARRHAARGALIPLKRLLAMPHPEWSARQAAGGARPQAAVSQPGSADTPAFYATVRALLDYLIARTGRPDVIRTLAAQAQAGASLEHWLLAAVPQGEAAGGLSALDAALSAFVLGDPEYTAASAGRAADQAR